MSFTSSSGSLRENEPLSAVILGAQGVLGDTQEIQYDAFSRALNEFGFTLERHEYTSEFLGLSTKNKLKHYSAKFGLSPQLHEPIYAINQQILLELIDETVRPNVEKSDFLKLLHQRGIQVGACSNSPSYIVERVLRMTGCSLLVDAVVGVEEVKRAKPRPDLYIEAARRLGVPIRQCVIIERDPVALLAAHAAGSLGVLKLKRNEKISAEYMFKLHKWLPARNTSSQANAPEMENRKAA